MGYRKVGQMLGEDFSVSDETADDIFFLMETSDVASTAEGASMAVKLGEQLQLAVEFFEDFKKDLTRGVAEGWFEPTCVERISKVADDNIALAIAKMN